MIHYADFETATTPEDPQFSIEWVGKGKKATQPPDPEFPDGIILQDPKLESGDYSCTVELDYPAPCVGVWKLRCEECGAAIGCTATGRPDDPRRMIIRCKNQPPPP